MKKFLAALLAATMVLGLCACGSSAPAPAAEAKSEAPAAEAKSEAPAAEASAVSEAKEEAAPAAGDNGIPVYEGTDVYEAIDMYNELFPDAYKIKFVSAADSNSYRNQSGGPQVLAYYLAKELPVRTEGRYVLDLYADGSLAGTASDTFSGILLGSFEMASLGSVDEYSDAFTELSVPFAFSGYDQILGVLQSGYQEVLAAEFEKDVEGVKLVSTAPGGFRQISNSKHEITSPADIAGMKFRTLAAPSIVKAFEAMGASVVSLSITELFTALQQGMVDGQENPITVFANNAFYDVQPYLTVCSYVYTPDVEFISKAFFDTMSPEDQQALLDICKEAQVAGFERQKELESELYDKCAENKCQITYLDDAQLAEFKTVMEEQVWPWVIEQIGQERWDVLQSYLK